MNYIAKLTRSGKTKYVVVRPHNIAIDLGNVEQREGYIVLTPEHYDISLWIEREESYHALMSDYLKSKRVISVERNDWMMAEEI
jgi:hypothetical protein